MALPMRLKSTVIAFIPVRLDGKMHALVIIGLASIPVGQPTGWQPGGISGHQTLVESNTGMRRDAAVQTCVSLANMASDALARVLVVEEMEKRVAALQSFANISSIISMDMDPANLYKAIHTEVLRIIGNVNFLIALYDQNTNMIQVPYLYEANTEDTSTIKQIPPFPMGEGLTSILINTRTSLMLVEDAEQKARELGAKTVGRASKSWLGVPLIVAGEVIGAIIVQDLEQENRFTQDDLQLLVTLGSQVAISLRTAQLLDNARKQVERQRLVSEITAKIRSSNNMNTILETTTTELRKALGAASTRLELGTQPKPSGDRDKAQD
jgi:transcriptional regulator with GAF, ATPase, and Fis domain